MTLADRVLLEAWLAANWPEVLVVLVKIAREGEA
jgi:hypothetical protein